MALENTNNSVEIDGIEFETIIPNSELKFSDKGAIFLPSLESANDLNRIPPFAAEMLNGTFELLRKRYINPRNVERYI